MTEPTTPPPPPPRIVGRRQVRPPIDYSKISQAASFPPMMDIQHTPVVMDPNNFKPRCGIKIGLDWEQFQDCMANVSHDELALHIGRQIIISLEGKMSVPELSDVRGNPNRTIDDPWEASNEKMG